MRENVGTCETCLHQGFQAVFSKVSMEGGNDFWVLRKYCCLYIGMSRLISLNFVVVKILLPHLREEIMYNSLIYINSVFA